jgi:hypothetical protein
MKYTSYILLPAFMLVSIVSGAQIKRGEKMLGGDLQVLFSKLKQESNNSTSKLRNIVVSPSIGFGFNNNWIAGAGISFQHAQSKSVMGTDDIEEKTNLVALAVFLRKFHAFNEDVGLFGQLDLSYGFGKVTDQSALFQLNEADATSYAATVSPGIYFKPTKRIILEAVFGRIGYINSEIERPGIDPIKNSELGFRFTNTLGVAFRIIL